MMRSSTLFGIFLLGASSTAFSMTRHHVSCQGSEGDKKIYLESLIEEDENVTRLLWATGAVESRSPFESGSINMFPNEVRQFSFDGSKLSLSMANGWTPARIHLSYDFSTRIGLHRGHGSVVVPPQAYGVEVMGAGPVNCVIHQVKPDTSNLPKLLPSGLYRYLLPSDQPVSLGLEVSENEILLNIPGSSVKVTLTSKDRLVWNSVDKDCSLSLHGTTGTGNTTDSFYLYEKTPCLYAKALGLTLAGPYRLAQ